MNLDELRKLIKIFEKADITEISVEEEGLKVQLKKTPAAAAEVPPHTHSQPASVYTYNMAPPADQAPQAPVPASPPPQPESAAEETPAENDPSIEVISSPMVGVFYVAPAPGEPSFVNAGDEVEADQTVCIVEAMKLMNEVTAKFPCTIERVLVENAEPVEFGQALFEVRRLDGSAG